jgi:hypothetical protein
LTRYQSPAFVAQFGYDREDRPTNRRWGHAVAATFTLAVAFMVATKRGGYRLCGRGGLPIPPEPARRP